MSAFAIVVAAGRGIRAGGDRPKQYRSLGGAPVLAHTLEAFLKHPRIDAVLPVINRDDAGLYEAVANGLAGRARLLDPALGGATRQESVANGLSALAAHADPEAIVLVHDGARPFVTPDLIDRALASAAEAGAAIPGIAVTDTIAVIDGEGRIADTPDRETLRAVQTPQAFRFDLLREAHDRARASGRQDFSDDGGLIRWAGHPVAVFPGDAGNVKLTRPEDFAMAESRLCGAAPVLTTRVGTGFDVHTFTEGDHVWLGGVRIPHDRGVEAHSDGDVILHALTDALLGTIADGDIGRHFPPSDPRWRGASSDRFLADAVARVRARGGSIDHLDVMLLAEAPRVGPHREAIRTRVAEIAGIAVGRVSLKATTMERLGFVGRREGLAAQATATVRLPENDE